MSDIFKREHGAGSGGGVEGQLVEQKRTEVTQKFKEFFVKEKGIPNQIYQKGVIKDGFREGTDQRGVPEITVYQDDKEVAFLGTKDRDGDVHIGNSEWGGDFVNVLKNQGFKDDDVDSGWKIFLD